VLLDGTDALGYVVSFLSRGINCQRTGTENSIDIRHFSLASRPMRQIGILTFNGAGDHILTRVSVEATG